jgi:TRAP-type C4-dicarboxylate transport system substrate-binding protein
MRASYGPAILAVLASAVSVPIAAAEETTLVFATAAAGDTHPNTQFLHPWAERINDAGKAVLKIDVRDGVAIATTANYYDRVMADVVQISWGLQSTVAGKFPRSDVATLPFMARSSEEGSVAFWRLYKSGILAAEYAGLHPLVLVALTAAGIHMSHRLQSLDDLGGAKLIIASKVNSDAITFLGGAPSSIPLTDMYEAIQRRAVDGAAVAWTSFNPFKLAEVTSYHVEVRLGTSVGMVFMTQPTYDKLSPEARKILDAYTGEAPSREFGAFWDAERKSGKEATLARAGQQTVVELSPKQADSWRQKMTPLADAWVKNTADGAKVLAAYRAELAKVQTGQ